MAGLGKRWPAYVPKEAVRELDRLSKADLMELLWDVAAMTTGHADDAPRETVLGIIRESHNALRFNGFQGSARLAGS